MTANRYRHVDQSPAGAQKSRRRVAVPVLAALVVASGTLAAAAAAATTSASDVSTHRHSHAHHATKRATKATKATKKKHQDGRKRRHLPHPKAHHPAHPAATSATTASHAAATTSRSKAHQPAATPPRTTTPVPSPSTGYPTASTTGVPAGTSLTARQGVITVNTPGTVIRGLNLTGRILVKAPNVTIEDSRITLPAGQHMRGIQNDSTGLKVDHVEITAPSPTWGTVGVTGGDFTVTNANIHGLVDAFNFNGSNVVIKDSWLHDNVRVANDPQHGGGPSHDDSIQIVGGHNITIQGNRFDGAKGAGIQITQDADRVSNVTVEDNLAGGGGCTINISQNGAHGGTPISGIVIRNNHFLTDQALAGCAIIRPTSTTVTSENNVWDGSGKAVQLSRG